MTKTELEAAAFRRLVSHLQERTDVQNIDLMNLAGFCRNCLSKWYAEAASESGLDLSKDDARERVYGMPYDEWKAQYQTQLPEDQYVDRAGVSGYVRLALLERIKRVLNKTRCLDTSKSGSDRRRRYQLDSRAPSTYRLAKKPRAIQLVLCCRDGPTDQR